MGLFWLINLINALLVCSKSVDLVREDNTKVNNHPTRKIQAIGAFASHQETSVEAHPYRTQAGLLLLALGKWKR